MGGYFWKCLTPRYFDCGSSFLEITESSAMLVPELVMHFMRDLRQRGITFALDDFGAGTTSFRYLRDFAFDIVKIDGQFTKNVAADSDN
jgi:EAL domain-containing protein (putative c-di-GMP-specific phosphodiesterase class I)